LIVIVLIIIFIRRKIIGDGSKSGDRSYPSSDDHNGQEKNLPMMMDQNSSSSRLIINSPLSYDPPQTPSSYSNDSQLGPPSVNNNNFYSSQNKNPVDSSSRDISPYSPQTSNSTQKDRSYSPDSYRGPSLDDDSLHLLQPQFTPNFQQKDLSYPSNSYKRSSRDGHSSPYLPQSPFTSNTSNTPSTPNTPNTPMTPPYPPNTYGGPSQDDYPSPFLPPSPFLSPSPFTPNFQQREQLHQPNSYGGPQNNQSNGSSQHFQQHYYIDPTQGTYQPQQYRSPPHSPHSLEDPPRSPLLSKSEPVSTNDQNSSSMSYQDTILVPPTVYNINNNNMDDDLSLNSEVTNNELKEIDDMIANIMNSENIPSSKCSHVSDNSFTNLLSDVPITSTNEKSNRPDSQTSSIYPVQPTQGMSQIEMASENKIPPSNPDHDHDLPQLMQPAAVRYIEPTQSNMVIERVNEPSDTSEVQLNMTQPITTHFIQPSQSNMKIEKVDAFRPEISAPIMTGVAAQLGPRPLYDIDGIKKHAKKVLSAKSEKKVDLTNESNSERVDETQNNENVVKENDGNQGEPLVRKKSVRFRTEPNQEEPIKVSKPKKSILINKDDDINIQVSNN
jgi:hypothetical protein